MHTLAAESGNVADMISVETTLEGESTAHTVVPLAKAAFLKVVCCNSENVDVIVNIRSRYIIILSRDVSIALPSTCV